MLKNIKIGTKLLVISGLLVLVPLVVVTYVAVVKSTTALTTVGSGDLQRGALFIAGGINHAMQEEGLFVKSLATRPSIARAVEAVRTKGVKSAGSEISIASNELKPFDDSKSLNHRTAGIMVMDTSGTVIIATHSDDLGRSFESDNFFQQAVRGTIGYGAIKQDVGDTFATLPVAVPVFAPGSTTVIGVLLEQLDPQFVRNLISEDTQGNTGFAFAVDQKGISIASGDKKVADKLDLLKTQGLASLGTAMVAGKTGVVDYVLGGAGEIAGIAPVKETGWSIALTESREEYLAPVVAFRDLAIVVAAIAIILTMVILIFFVRSITKPLGQAVDYAKIVASGDFTRRLEVDRKDEVGILTSTLDEMVDKLHVMIVQIRDAAEQTASSSEEISSSAQQLSAGAQNQASTLEETSASVEELTASVEQVSDHAQSQAASVEESSSNMEQMQTSVQQVSKTLEEVSRSSEDSMQRAQGGMDAVSKAVEAINSISQSSEQIAGIINVISDIADQTNLLALNASIEAARAGEHGRGFAVVADEVSKLADRSSSSTKEIEELIKQSSKSVNLGVEIAQAALDSMQAIIAGAEKTNEMVTALASDIEQQINGIREVATATESISEMSQSISAATEEQTTNAKQVAKAIENVNDLTQQAAGAAEEMSAATEQLSALAQQMQRLVEQFKLNEQEASRVLPGPAQHRGESHYPGLESRVAMRSRPRNGNGSGGNGSNGNGSHLTGTMVHGSQAPLDSGDLDERGVVLKKGKNGTTG